MLTKQDLTVVRPDMSTVFGHQVKAVNTARNCPVNNLMNFFPVVYFVGKEALAAVFTACPGM